MSNELIREIDDALKQDKVAEFFKRFAKHMVYGCVASVAIATAVVLWRGHMQHVHEAQTDTLLEAHRMFLSKRYEDAKKELTKLTADSSGEMAAMATIWLAKTQTELGELNDAVESLAQVQKLGVNDSPLAKLACLQGAMLATDDERFNACLAAKPTDPLAPLLAEISAIKQIKAGKTSGVKESLPDPSLLPVSQKQRITDLNAYLSSSIHADQ